jgi:hypothetical protein
MQLTEARRISVAGHTRTVLALFLKCGTAGVINLLANGCQGLFPRR